MISRIEDVVQPTLEKQQHGLSHDDALLAALGYKQELKRQFSALEVFGVAFSIIGLLPSIASVLSLAIPYGGPAAMVWGWAVASVFILCIGLSMSELASAAPTSGGLYFWTHSLAAPRYRNLLAWMVGYANTVGTISSVASIDWGCAVQIAAAVSISSDGAHVASHAQLYGIYAAIVVSHVVICCLATRTLARLQNVYIALNVLLCLAVIIALPAATPKALMNDAGYALGEFANLSGWPAGFAFILSMQAAHWTIGGFDSTVHISEEASNAAVAVPHAIVGAIFISGVLGTAINIALAFCMGKDLEGLLTSGVGQPMAQIFYNSFGKGPTLGLWALVVVVQYTMGSSALVSSSRQVFAFSRDGALPLSRLLYRVNARTGTPATAVLFCGTICLLLGTLVFAGATAINAIFSLAIVASYVAYSVPIAARLARPAAFAPGPFTLGRWSRPIGATAVAWMAFISVVFLFPAEPRTGVAGANYTVSVLGGVLLAALGWYYCPRVGGVHWFRGPVANTGVRAGDARSDGGSVESAEKEEDEKSVPTVIVSESASP